MGNKTQEKYKRAKELIPGGVQLLSKSPEQFAPGQWPGYFAKAKGCEVWDLDGNHYYDMTTNGIGACMLGFADPDVSAAVIRRVENGSMCTLNPPEEVELADVYKRQVLDIEKFVKLAHSHGVPLICDNTFATPVNCRPFEWGVDIVTHSTTKYMDGHGMAVGGAIVDSGNFDWTAHGEKFPGLTTPDESYHGIIYTQRFGKGAYIQKAVAQMMRDLGACQSPQNAFLTNVGLETLHLRVPRHCENAEKVAAFLKNHPKVEWVEDVYKRQILRESWNVR